MTGYWIATSERSCALRVRDQAIRGVQNGFAFLRISRSHDTILTHVPVFRAVIAGWLKAGVFTGKVFDPTEAGTHRGLW